MIDTGINEGAELKVDGRNHGQDKGWFVGGCLFDHVTATYGDLSQRNLWPRSLCCSGE